MTKITRTGSSTERSTGEAAAVAARGRARPEKAPKAEPGHLVSCTAATSGNAESGELVRGTAAGDHQSSMQDRWLWPPVPDYSTTTWRN